MNNRVQPDSNPSRTVEPRIPGASAPARTESIDALFAQALASVAAVFAPAGVPTLGGVPAPATQLAPTARSESKKKLTEAESLEDTPTRHDESPREPGVLDVNTPMSAAQHARQELRRVSGTGAANDAPTLSDPAASEETRPQFSQGAPAAKLASPPADGGRGEPRSADQADTRQESTNSTGATRPSGSLGSSTTSNQSAGQKAGGAAMTPQNGAVAPLATATNAVGAPASAQAAASAPGKVDAAGWVAAGKADPMVALGALGARSSRVRFTAESTANQAAPRSASLPDQVARGLATLLRHQGGSVTLRLTPETLGQIKINLKIEDAHVWATFQPSSEASRDAINQSLASLRAALESRGLVVERLELAPAGLANFEQSLRGPNLHSSSPGEPSLSHQGDQSATGSQTGSHAGEREARQNLGASASSLSGAQDVTSTSDTELLPDSIGSALMLVEDSPSESGMARRLRLDAVA